MWMVTPATKWILEEVWVTNGSVKSPWGLVIVSLVCNGLYLLSYVKGEISTNLCNPLADFLWYSLIILAWCLFNDKIVFFLFYLWGAVLGGEETLLYFFLSGSSQYFIDFQSVFFPSLAILPILHAWHFEGMKVRGNTSRIY